MFLKGLELYQSAQLDRAAMQFQNSMQAAPTFAPSRLFLGASLAEANRHKEAAGLLQSAAVSLSPPPAGATSNAAIARIAGRPSAAQVRQILRSSKGAIEERVEQQDDS